MEYEYVMMKLTSGEDIICVLIDINEHSFTVMFPLSMKHVSLDGLKETIAGTSWCPYTDEHVFTIFRSDVIVIAPLNQRTIEYYKKLVDLSELDEYIDIEDEYFSDPSQTIH